MIVQFIHFYISGTFLGKMACVRRFGNNWNCLMNGVRLFGGVGLRASACSLAKIEDFKWHTSSRMYSAFTFTRPVSFMAVTLTVDKGSNTKTGTNSNP